MDEYDLNQLFFYISLYEGIFDSLQLISHVKNENLKDYILWGFFSVEKYVNV